MSTMTLASVGKRIKKARHERGFTQQQLAKAVGKSKQLVSAWEGGRAEMMATSLALLAKALSVEPSWILFGTDSNSALPMLPIGKSVPLLGSHHVFVHASGRLDLRKVEKRLYAHGSVSDAAFAVSANDDGMRPAFSRGDLLIIDPDAEIEPGCIVLAVLLKSAAGRSVPHATLIREVHAKSLELQSGALSLVPRYSAYPTVDLTNGTDVRVLGRAVGLQKSLPVE